MYPAERITGLPSDTASEEEIEREREREKRERRIRVKLSASRKSLGKAKKSDDEGSAAYRGDQ